MYFKKEISNAPAIYTCKRMGLEIISFKVDKKLDVIATYRREGRCGRQAVRTDEYGGYLAFGGERIYMDELRRCEQGELRRVALA